jgi:hypothetical protein
LFSSKSCNREYASPGDNVGSGVSVNVKGVLVLTGTLTIVAGVLLDSTKSVV